MVSSDNDYITIISKKTIRSRVNFAMARRTLRSKYAIPCSLKWTPSVAKLCRRRTLWSCFQTWIGLAQFSKRRLFALWTRLLKCRKQIWKWRWLTRVRHKICQITTHWTPRSSIRDRANDIKSLTTSFDFLPCGTNHYCRKPKPRLHICRQAGYATATIETWCPCLGNCVYQTSAPATEKLPAPANFEAWNNAWRFAKLSPNAF